MGVLASSYLASWSAGFVQIAADTDAFQALVKEVTSDLAKNHIIEDDAGEANMSREKRSVNGTELDLLFPWLVVSMGDSKRVERALNTWGWEGDAAMMLAIPFLDGDTATEALRRGRNAASDLAVGMQALVNSGPDRPPFATFDPATPYIAEQTGSKRNNVFVPIAITWRDIP